MAFFLPKNVFLPENFSLKKLLKKNFCKFSSNNYRERKYFSMKMFQEKSLQNLIGKSLWA